MLKVQKYLKKHSLEDLAKEYSIKYNTYTDGIVLLNYSIDSPLFVRIVEECRGLILDKNLEVMCKSFNRFYNINERKHTIDFENSFFYKKIDGDLINLYYNRIKEEWCFASKCHPFGEDYIKSNLIHRKVKQEKITYKELLNRIIFFNQNDLKKILNDYKDYTFSFEVVSPDNKNIIYYHEYSLYYIGCHSNITGKFEDIDFLSLVNLTSLLLPEKFTFANQDELDAYMNELSTNDEGLVIYNKKTKEFIKYKNKKYIQNAYMNENHICTLKNFAYLISKDEINEYLSYFPNDKKQIESYIDKLKDEEKRLNEIYEKYKNLSLNEYALAVMNDRNRRLLIHMYKNQMTVKESLMNSNSLSMFTNIL